MGLMVWVLVQGDWKQGVDADDIFQTVFLYRA